MNAVEAVKAAAADAGMPITHIGRAMGKRDNYVSVAANKGTDPGTAITAAMFAACGYSLVAVPSGSVPPGALVIDPPAR